MTNTTPKPETATKALRGLITEVGSRNPAQQAQAETAVRNLTSEEITQLVRLARTEPTAMMFRMGLWFAVVFWPMAMLPAWASFGMGSSIPALWRWLVLVVALCAYIPLFTLLVAKPRLQSGLYWSLTLVDDMRVLGPLILIFSRPDQEMSPGHRLRKLAGWRGGNTEAIREALLRLLARIQPGQDLDITSAERRGLQNALRVSDPEVVLALLRLLEQIGNSQYLPYVRKLESGKRLAATHPAVRNAASVCRAAIEERLAKHTSAGTLLRASGPTVAAETLVRPASATQPTEKAELLRATLPNDSTDKAV